MNYKLKSQLTSYIQSLRPIIYIEYFDLERFDDLIAEIADEEGLHIEEFCFGEGYVEWPHRVKSSRKLSLEDFLMTFIDSSDTFESKHTVILLKDIHSQMESATIVSLIRLIASASLYQDVNFTILMISNKLQIPEEIREFVTVIDIPLPDADEITLMLNDFESENDYMIDSRLKRDLSLLFRGLNEFQIRQILNLAYHNNGTIEENDKQVVLDEKTQIIRKSGLIEIVQVKERLEDIGGLENLKTWLHRKSQIFHTLDEAISFGVDVPKGVFIVGLPGCGKSLAAKATAKLFDVPLLRLDIGRLFGKYVGESEENMRKALKIAESASPCVLWIDEIEKAFSGIGDGGSGNSVTTRLFGNFLTWMQEKERPVFVVATANDVSKLPPEFLRKGRFDEIFYVGMPNRVETKKILEIHLRKRRKWNESIDLEKVVANMFPVANAKNSEKEFCGADIESAVKQCIEDAFIEKRSELSTEDLIKTVKTTTTIKEVMGKDGSDKSKIDTMKNRFKELKLVPASRD